jgi:hemerythrin-like domain-containing protein
MKRTATAALRAEHRLILRVLDVFDRITATPAGALPVADIADCIDFFRLYTDACHHGKEEDLLFTTMEEHDLGAAGPIAAMREEHRQGRALVRAMAAALGRLQAGDALAVRELLGGAAAYSGFLRAHISREDDGLFDLADREVDGPACAALCAQYDETCGHRFEGRSVTDLEALAAGLIERYATAAGRPAATQ